MRKLTSFLGFAGAMLLALAGVSGCAGSNAAGRRSPSASAYVPQPTTPGKTVAYLDIRNNGKPDRLIAVHTSVGGTVQMRAPETRHDQRPDHAHRGRHTDPVRHDDPAEPG